MAHHDPIHLIAPRAGLAQLNERSRDIFRQIVESYLATGEPVGSRNISRLIAMPLSPASVRNVMADLEQLGHHVAHRGRRQRNRDQARDIARADGFAGRQITLDDLPKNIARALIELGEPGIAARSGQSDRGGPPITPLGTCL